MRKVLFGFALWLGVCIHGMAASILVISISSAGISDYATTAVNGIGDALSASGHTVTKQVFTGATTGEIATALSGGSYSQLFFLDVASAELIGSSDVAAIRDFWERHKGLVVDARSYGYIFQPSEPSEVALIGNVAQAFTLTGGGVWIGTDDSPVWAYNGNAILNAIGVNPVVGNYSLPVNVADPSSVLLQSVIPANLWAVDGTVGMTPIGVQPNGIEMFMHFGNDTGGTLTPYISASFPLAGPPPAPPAPVEVPVNHPVALALLVLLLSATRIVLWRKQR